MKKNIKVISITLGLIGILTYTYASVPNKFTPNTVVKSSEINENFDSLDGRIENLEKNTKDKDSSENTSIWECNGNPFEYKYEYIANEIGDIITVGDKKYRIIAVPFEEFKSKKHFIVTYPVRIDENKAFRTSIYTSYVKKGDKCYPNKINGFPAEFNNIGYSKSISVGSNYEHLQTTDYHNYLNIEGRSSSFVSIKINQTTLHVYMSLSHELQKKDFSSNHVDFSKEVDWKNMESPDTLVENIKTLLNYVNIAEIEE